MTAATAATLSAAATAAGTVTATLGAQSPQVTGYGIGWSPETDAEADSYSVAAVNAGVVPPDRITNPNTPVWLVRP